MIWRMVTEDNIRMVSISLPQVSDLALFLNSNHHMGKNVAASPKNRILISCRYLIMVAMDWESVPQEDYSRQAVDDRADGLLELQANGNLQLEQRK